MPSPLLIQGALGLGESVLLERRLHRVDVVETLTTDIVLAFLRHTTEMLETLYERIDDLVSKDPLLEKVATERVDIEGEIAQISKARDGIIKLLPERNEEHGWLDKHRTACCTIGTIVLVLQDTPRTKYSRGEVLRVRDVLNPNTVDGEGEPFVNSFPAGAGQTSTGLGWIYQDELERLYVLRQAPL